MQLCIATWIAVLLGSTAVFAAPVTAIGTFARRLDSPVSKEIILRFPIFLSKAYARAQKGRVMYPNEFIRLREENKIPARILYTPEEYAALAKILNGGSLVTGEIYEYEPKKPGAEESHDETVADVPKEKMVFVRIHHYNSETRKIVSFSVYSKPETIVIDLVRHLLPLEKDRYIVRPIAAGSKIAVIAPLDAVSLNNFLAYLMELKFDVRMASGNDYETLQPQELEPLREIRSNAISYSTAALPYELTVPPLSAALDNEAEREAYNEFAALYSKKLTGFERSLGSTLASFRNKTNADYLLVLQPHGKNPFARGFDLNRGGLAWFQDTFPSKSSAAGEVLAAMIAEMQRPMKTLDDAQFEKIAQEKDRMAAQGASGGLASVAILDFYDRTNSPLYGWMSKSLSIAVDDSMKKIFEYDRANEQKSAEVGARLFRSPSDVTPKNLKEFQAQTGADYLILGFYSVNPQNGNIVIESRVYDLVRKTAIGGSTTESPVDVRLFNVVDEIAQGIVQDIFLMTQTQNK
jgi:TolB-like protein